MTQEKIENINSPMITEEIGKAVKELPPKTVLEKSFRTFKEQVIPYLTIAQKKKTDSSFYSVIKMWQV